jgi:hypothetical protein
LSIPVWISVNPSHDNQSLYRDHVIQPSTWRCRLAAWSVLNVCILFCLYSLCIFKIRLCKYQFYSLVYSCRETNLRSSILQSYTLIFNYRGGLKTAKQLFFVNNKFIWLIDYCWMLNILWLQPQVIQFTSCLPNVGGSLRVLRLLPPLKLVAMIYNVAEISISWIKSIVYCTLYEVGTWWPLKYHKAMRNQIMLIKVYLREN